MSAYNPTRLEKKWQKYWSLKKVYFANNKSKKPKKYVLIEFAYPSGLGLHMGHLRPYVAGDVYSRYLRMRGYEVLYPMGWDAFGLPAENFAIKHGIHPRISTAKNIKNSKRQTESWGIGFDWSREINTTDPQYYKWTQWIFLQLYKAGLAYEAVGLINWCPKDKTGLANEEVVGGVCERCGTTVQKKELRQWYLRITAYADKLLAGLKNLDWPESVKLQQENWIGRSEGSEIEFELTGIANQNDGKHCVKVFTTRPDTIFGATFIAVAPELAQEWLKLGWQTTDEIIKYVEESLKRTEEQRGNINRAKTGVFSGIYALNPASHEKIPVWIADYVLGNYGTGAIMGVPAHDERDAEFAKTFKLAVSDAPLVDVNQVMQSVNGRKVTRYKLRDWVFSRQRYWGEPIPIIHCTACAGKQIKTQINVNFYDQNNWQAIIDGKKTIETRALNPNESHRYFGSVKVGEQIGLINHKTKERRVFNVLRTWQFKSLAEVMMRPELTVKIWPKRTPKTVAAAERLWSQYAPDYLERIRKHGLVAWELETVSVPVPVPEKNLPVKLPEVKKYQPTGTGESPLAAIKNWVNTKCPQCHQPAKRETNTMPQWAGSSWYYLRYIDPRNKKTFAQNDQLKHWLPVDVYFGGMEHTTLHLLYSRFWHQALFDLGHVPTPEPYALRVPHGVILGPDGERMSKSRGNVVNPDEVVAEYGADALRMYELFLGPHGTTIAWNTQGIVGVHRFLNRVWRLYQNTHFANHSAAEVLESTHLTLKNVGEDIAGFRFNTVVSELMKLLNQLEELSQNGKVLGKDTAQNFLLMLAPLAPHLAEELWQGVLKNKGSIHQSTWPEFKAEAIVSDNVTIVVQVNGVFRGTLTLTKNTPEAKVLAEARLLPRVMMQLAKTEIKKTIFVPDKLINLIVG